MAGGPRTGDVRIGSIRFELRERPVRPSPTQIRDPHLRDNPGPVEPPKPRRRGVRVQSHDYDRRAAQPTTTPPEMVTKIVDLYCGGMSTREVAETLDVSRAVVQRYCKEAGVLRRTRKNVTAEQVAQRYEEGYSIQEVAKHFGISNVTVRNRLKDAGVASRSQGAWRAMRRERSAVGAVGEDQS